MIAEEAKNTLLREEHNEYYLTGQLHYNFFTIDKAFDGLFREWHRGGQLANEIEYKESKLHGSFKQWNVNGMLVFHTEFDEGKEIVR